MSRLFDGTDDQMVYNGPVQLTGAFTLLIVAKFATTTDASWQSLIEQESSGGIVKPTMGRNNSGSMYYANEAGTEFGNVLSIQDGDGWSIYAATKASGTVNVSYHRIPLSGSRTTASSSSTYANSSAYASGFLRIGGNDDFANIYVGVAATFTTALTTTTLDGILAAKTTQSVLDAGAVWCVDDGSGDGLATDRVGSVNRSSLTGTTDSGDDPSGWVYFGEGGAAASLLWRPTSSLYKR